jgi:predicted SAM-dependent methyltransferase
MMVSANNVLKGFVLRIWPKDLINQWSFETRAAATHFRSWALFRGRFGEKKGLKINVGCGGNVVPGWINIDLSGPSEVFRWDCRRGLPFDDSSVETIFAEHVFEHLDPDRGDEFLRECRRCLRPGGIVRIVVPDAGRYLSLYQGDWTGLASIRPLIPENGAYRDWWLDRKYRTKMEFINEIFRQGGEHKYAYDKETLMLRLTDAGFSRVVQQSYGVSLRDEEPLDTEARGPESLYVEGVK